ncbi:transcription factor bHLH25 [Cocos nucifera]|uniref:Transcription factor bHLH25 n=1 Tax=Cocos nucifera TaxID=13894 RepID=A0A8K0IWC0_COCNU|nr:transcription factor bHLH25 [Cocos nucifera]
MEVKEATIEWKDGVVKIGTEGEGGVEDRMDEIGGGDWMRTKERGKRDSNKKDVEGVDDLSLIYECDMSLYNQFNLQVAPAPVGQQSLSSESYTSHPSFHPAATAPQTGFIERPKKAQKINRWSSHDTEKNATNFGLDAPSPDSLSFRHPNSPNKSVSVRAVASQEEMRPLVSHGSARNYETISHQVSRTTKMGPVLSQAHEHIIAERKRREKLSQRFIALSAVIPGLKKKDKASVLGDAVKHIKELQERVKTLEDQNATRTIESKVLIKKSKLSADDDRSFSNEFSNGCSSEEPLPEIEVMLSEKTVLVRIHCENQRGVLVEEEFSMTVEDLARKLNSALRNSCT